MLGYGNTTNFNVFEKWKNMKNRGLAIIGSGPTALYCLKHILEHAAALLRVFTEISIYEKNDEMGHGMPYNPKMTDKYNLANITSKEIPKLPQTLAGWLKNQSQTHLKRLAIHTTPIQDDHVYSRIAIGAYFRAQFKILVTDLKKSGFKVNEFPKEKVLDILPIDRYKAEIKSTSLKYVYSKIIIATGHTWINKDNPISGYYDSPWPIQKILPKNNQLYNFEIGLLGAALSAFDVVSSLAHRHGTFSQADDRFVYKLKKEVPKFKIMLHALKGWLPHLEYEQSNPFRKIYRHTSQKEMRSLKKDKSTSIIASYFDKICRPVLLKALKKDKLPKVEASLENPKFGFGDFIDMMANKHQYLNSFEGMRTELRAAETLAYQRKPVHWMEALDDLMYCLNFHTEYFTAEDHIFFEKKIMPFLMNVIAALPCNSAKILLALYDANCIELLAGKVEILSTKKSNKTEIVITDQNGTTAKRSYNMFINCSGNDNIEFEDFPFKSLKKQGTISVPKAQFSHPYDNPKQHISKERLTTSNNKLYLNVGGISINEAFHIIDETGKPSHVIQDLAFNHTYGLRPYSYGLQACNTSSKIAISALISNA